VTKLRHTMELGSRDVVYIITTSKSCDNNIHHVVVLEAKGQIEGDTGLERINHEKGTISTVVLSGLINFFDKNTPPSSVFHRY
jgi:hypothetical protein